MFTFKSVELLAILIMIGLPAYMPSFVSSDPSTSTPTLAPNPSQLPTDSRLVLTRAPLATVTPAPTMTVPPLPDDKRIVASIDVGTAPWTMAVANESLWVIAGNSIVQIDPQTDKMLGKPIPVNVPKNAGLEAIMAGEGAL